MPDFTSASERLCAVDQLIDEDRRRRRKKLNYPEIKGSRSKRPTSFVGKLKSFSLKLWGRYRWEFSFRAGVQ